jgi:hypothetical protein
MGKDRSNASRLSIWGWSASFFHRLFRGKLNADFMRPGRLSNQPKSARMRKERSHAWRACFSKIPHVHEFHVRIDR